MEGIAALVSNSLPQAKFSLEITVSHQELRLVVMMCRVLHQQSISDWIEKPLVECTYLVLFVHKCLTRVSYICVLILWVLFLNWPSYKGNANVMHRS